MNKKRIGRFWITRTFVEDNPEGVVELFYQLKIIVTRCEMQYHRDVFEYIGVSPNFREVPFGEILPDYIIIAHRDSEGNITYSIKDYEPFTSFENIKL